MEFLFLAVSARKDFKLFCSRCNTKYSLDRGDGLCARCRSRKKYLANIDSYRKTKVCICGKAILKTSNLCSSCSQLGENNHRWKEIKQDRGIYFTSEYRKWRLGVFRKFGKACLFCGSNYRVAAHHIFQKRDFPEKQYDVNNGVPLCHKCHSKMQFKEDKFRAAIMAEVKLRESGEPCNGNAALSQSNLESVTTRGEINSSTSAGQPI